MNHIGIYLSNKADESSIIKKILDNKFLSQQIDLSNMEGAVYSTSTIEKYIDEELAHDKFTLTGSNTQSLITMSSGQQRIALLNYILANKPQYLILDDIFGSIDKTTRKYTTEQLHNISNHTLLIQIFHRKSDMLSMIKTIITVDNDNNIKGTQSTKEFKESIQITSQNDSVFLPELFSENPLTIDPLIELKDLNVKYVEKPVLKNVNWTIRSGEFWQLAGPNGSGKSTLVSMIIGDNPKAYGQNMMLFGHKKGSGESVWELKKQIGYFTPAIISHFKHNDTVKNMIISGLVDSIGLYKKPTNIQQRIAQAWVQLLGPTYQNRYFQQLSHGQQRIVMVARAMVKHPPLLILDEPTVGLDDENAALFISMVKAIALPRKVAIIYVSHRDEPDLKPDKMLELVPTNEGSKGIIGLLPV